MKTLETLQRLEQMDQLIRLKSTGSPNLFATRLGISKSSLYNYLEILKLLGGPVRYNSQILTTAQFRDSCNIAKKAWQKN
jgi:predicted DNA-binding transcriptional regulator YafY